MIKDISNALSPLGKYLRENNISPKDFFNSPEKITEKYCVTHCKPYNEIQRLSPISKTWKIAQECPKCHDDKLIIEATATIKEKQIAQNDNDFHNSEFNPAEGGRK